jgi:16S rRNA (guanine966-N2)-methyltransferase
MRVVAGQFRGRRLVAPPGRAVRPTRDGVREAVFAMLDSMGVVKGASVLDLFAGTGALGIEALSRGAAQVTFVERDPGVLSVLRANLDRLGLGEPTATVVGADVVRFLARDARGRPPADLALCDPPYAFSQWPELLGLVPARLVVVESGTELPTVDGWLVRNTRRYGGTLVSLLQATCHDHTKGPA